MKKSILSMFIILVMIFIQLPQIYAKENIEVTFEETDTVQISTLAGLEAFRDDVNGGNTYEGKTIELTADIDMSEKYGEGKEIWTPIGIGIEFEGTFNGNGHTIKMNHVDPYYYSDSALFGLCGEKSHITRLTIDGIVKVGTPTEDDNEWAQQPFYLGGIAVLSMGRISNCHNKAEIIGFGNGAYTAGICGLLGGTIENCINTGKVDGGHVSEAISTSSGSGISNCYYLSGTAECGTDAKAMTAEQFASGEVCYLLNGGRSDGAWYQNIGSDAFPVLDSTHSAVYFDGERYYNKINAKISMYMLSDEDYGTPFTFTAYEELEAYVNQNDLGEYNSNRLLEMYPREFFDDKFLYVRYADSGSGSNLYDVQTSENENDIEIVITKTQEGMTDDYIEYCLYAELDKSLLGKNINVVSKNIDSHYNYYFGRVQTQNEFIPEDRLKLDYAVVNSNDELNSVWNGDEKLKTAYGTEFFRNKSLLIVSWDQANTERNHEVASVVLSDDRSEVTLSYFAADGADTSWTESYSAVIAIPKTYSATQVTITTTDGENIYPYKITSICLTDTAGEVIALPNIGQSFIVKTGIHKLCERDEQDYLCVAVYDEYGALMNIDCEKANIAVGGEYIFESNVPSQDKKIGYVKAFVWNTISSMEPLAEVKIYAPVECKEES